MRPHEAFDIALKHGPENFTRNAVAKGPAWAFLYALIIDMAPHPVTKDATFASLYWSNRYSLIIEKRPPAPISPMPDSLTEASIHDTSDYSGIPAALDPRFAPPQSPPQKG